MTAEVDGESLTAEEFGSFFVLLVVAVGVRRRARRPVLALAGVAIEIIIACAAADVTLQPRPPNSLSRCHAYG